MFPCLICIIMEASGVLEPSNRGEAFPKELCVCSSESFVVQPNLTLLICGTVYRWYLLCLTVSHWFTWVSYISYSTGTFSAAAKFL